MRKISSLFGKPTISSANGEFLGTVTGVLCGKSLKTVEYLNILKDSDTLSDYLFVAPRSVKSISDESVVLTNNLCIKNAAEIKGDNVEFPIGGKIYSAKGDTVGAVADLFFSDTTKNVQCIVTEDGTEILPERVSSVSYGVITLLPDDMTRKRAGAPKKIPSAPENTPVQLFDEEAKIETPIAADTIPLPLYEEEKLSSETIVVEAAEKLFTPEITAVPLAEAVAAPVKRSFMPARVICNYRFLLGRIVINNIYDKRHVLIIKKDSLITSDVVLIAHKHNKLVELTLNSRL